MMKGFTRNSAPLKILSEEEVETIHCGTLNILEKTGIRVDHKRALDVFEKNDCKVDRNEKRVRIPSAVAEECLRRAPSSFNLRAREPENDLQIGGTTTYIMPFPGMRILNLDNWQTRPATQKERIDAITVLDALDTVHCFGPYTPYFEVEDIIPAMSIPEGVAALLRYSTKAIATSAYQLDCEVFNIAMAKAVGAELAVLFNESPPLTFRFDAIEAMFRAIEAGFPVWLAGGATLGATAPATIAGATLINNAQSVAAVVLAQLIKRGTKIMCSHSLTYTQNMRNGVLTFGGIEGLLSLVAFNQLWRRYGIPTNAAIPGASSAKRIDFQCGYERALGTLVAALSGASVIMLHGGVYGELSWHPIQAVLDDDIAGMVGRFFDGIKVSDETLAIDLINKVGPIPGFYLDKEHTRTWWKKEWFIPKSADRISYPEWSEKGCKSAIDYAKERTEEILATHKPKPLTASQEAEIEKILDEAKAYYKGKGLM